MVASAPVREAFVWASSLVRMLLVAVKLEKVARPAAVAVARLAMAVAVSCWSSKAALALW